jgi:hypothetical protein
MKPNTNASNLLILDEHKSKEESLLTKCMAIIDKQNDIEKKLKELLLKCEFYKQNK